MSSSDHIEVQNTFTSNTDRFDCLSGVPNIFRFEYMFKNKSVSMVQYTTIQIFMVVCVQRLNILIKDVYNMKISDQDLGILEYWLQKTNSEFIQSIRHNIDCERFLIFQSSMYVYVYEPTLPQDHVMVEPGRCFMQILSVDNYFVLTQCSHSFSIRLEKLLRKK